MNELLYGFQGVPTAAVPFSTVQRQMCRMRFVELLQYPRDQPFVTHLSRLALIASGVN